MTDTERMDWLSRNLGAVLCELLWKRGFTIPVHGKLRDILDAAMKQGTVKEPTR